MSTSGLASDSLDPLGLPGSSPAHPRRDRQVVGVVSLAHGTSHFFHLLVAPLFPWLKTAFDVSYAELGLLMTVFFLVSGIGQAVAGFIVDRVGAFPVLLASLALFVLASGVVAIAPSYPILVLGCALAGLGNAPFHPVDYSLLNARVAPARLGKAYAVHGLAGNLGWGLAPVYLVTITQLTHWRIAALAAGLLAAVVLVVVWLARDLINDAPRRVQRASAGQAPGGSAKTDAATGTAAASGLGSGSAPKPESSFAFLRLQAVWLSFGFFFILAIAGGTIQSFGPESARLLHGVEPQWAALCLTMYMVASAGGMLMGGYLVVDPLRAERVVATGFGGAALVALAIGLASWPGWAVPLLFALLGLGAGSAGPARDLLVRRATPPGATGRVYGTVYSGLDAGMALAPAVFGILMDRGLPTAVWLGVAASQTLLILGALRVGRLGRRNAEAAAS